MLILRYTMLIIAFSLLMEYGIMLFVKILENIHVFLHFAIILRYIWFNKMLMKYGDMMFRDFFRETA